MTTDIPADVIERCWHATPPISREDVFLVLRAAGWPELVAERDRLCDLGNKLTLELGEAVPIDDATKIVIQQRALIAELAAGLREARDCWIADGVDPMRGVDVLVRIDALLAKAEGK